MDVHQGVNHELRMMQSDISLMHLQVRLYCALITLELPGWGGISWKVPNQTPGVELTLASWSQSFHFAPSRLNSSSYSCDFIFPKQMARRTAFLTRVRDRARADNAAARVMATTVNNSTLTPPRQLLSDLLF